MSLCAYSSNRLVNRRQNRPNKKAVTTILGTTLIIAEPTRQKEALLHASSGCTAKCSHDDMPLCRYRCYLTIMLASGKMSRNRCILLCVIRRQRFCLEDGNGRTPLRWNLKCNNPFTGTPLTERRLGQTSLYSARTKHGRKSWIFEGITFRMAFCVKYRM